MANLMRELVVRLYDDECGNCGARENLVIHHIVPESVGGTNRLGNLACLCVSCHRKIPHPEPVTRKHVRKIRKARPAPLRERVERALSLHTDWTIRQIAEETGASIGYVCQIRQALST